MRSKRATSQSWLHRWSRPIIAAIATTGAVVTAYLTITKLTGGETVCPVEGCDVVLNSPYATVFGQPLALFGFLAYVSMVIFAIAPLLISATDQRELRTKVEEWTGLLLFLGGTAMMVFSAYLMYVLAFRLQVPCIYCIASALFALSMFLLAIFGRTWQDIGQLLFSGIIVVTVVLVGTLAVYSNATVANSGSDTVPGESGPAITTTSGASEIALAEFLTESGAKMYGAWWCPHCHDQKQLFGKEAVEKIPYIECDPAGKQPQVEQCKAAGLQGYPTWKIKDQTLTGAQPLSKLADVAGYTGPRTFQNSP